MAGDKKGCLLIQFPASIKVFYFNTLKRLLEDVTGGNAGWKLAVEFRDRSWYNDTVYQLLEDHRATIVVHDMPKSATPVIDMEQDIVYLRFHGEKGDYRGSYADEVLQEYAASIKAWRKERKQVFAYFNNTLGGAVQNAMRLSGFVGVI
jgi:uncharacterized protein YecE (DUF72 family)